MKKIRIFLASSGDLSEERNEIEKYLSRKNDSLVTKEVYFELRTWEKLSFSFSQQRKQNEFNNEVIQSDIFLCLIFDKVGQFTYEEFQKAYENFRQHQKPKKLLLYFKDAPISLGKITNEYKTVLSLKKEIKKYGQIWNEYQNTHQLLLSIDKELELLLSSEIGINTLINLELISNHCILDIQDSLGELVLFEKRSHIKAFKAFSSYRDSLYVDGKIDHDLIAVDPGNILSLREVEESRLEIETDLGFRMGKGEELIRTLNCKFLKSFCNSEEYWVEEQVNPTNRVKTTIIFPESRPPLEWKCVKLRGWHEEEFTQPRCRLVFGRYRLEFQAKNEKIHDRFKITWRW